MVDCSDPERIDKARTELHKILDTEDMENVVLLVIENKQDFAVMDTNEDIEKLDLESIKGRPWYCQKTTALTGDGLIEGFTWLDKTLSEVKK